MFKVIYLFLVCVFAPKIHATQVMDLDLIVQQAIQKNKKLISMLAKKANIDVANFKIKKVKVKTPSVVAVDVQSTLHLKLFSMQSICNSTRVHYNAMFSINEQIGSVKVQKKIKVYAGPKSAKYALAYSSKGKGRISKSIATF